MRTAVRLILAVTAIAIAAATPFVAWRCVKVKGLTFAERTVLEAQARAGGYWQTFDIRVRDAKSAGRRDPPRQIAASIMAAQGSRACVCPDHGTPLVIYDDMTYWYDTTPRPDIPVVLCPKPHRWKGQRVAVACGSAGVSFIPIDQIPAWTTRGVLSDGR